MPRRKQDTPLKVNYNKDSEICPDNKVSSKTDVEYCYDKSREVIQEDDTSVVDEMKEENNQRTDGGEIDGEMLNSSCGTSGCNDAGDLKEVAVNNQTSTTESAQVEDSKTASECRSEDLSQKYLMESLLQHQKQLYDQCSNNWINVQRSDNNCLSKSKAERYRWCVQEADTKRNSSSGKTNASHVANVKKTASSLLGVTHPMQEKLYRTVFTGASKFRCRDCGKSFNTLVDLTVHMNKSGHYRDENLQTSADKAKSKKTSSKHNNKKNPAPEVSSSSECSEKVLKCMGCGYSFDSLQDLSVHMMKTKHYEQVPSLQYWSQRYNQGAEKHKQNSSNASSSASADNQHLLKQAQSYSHHQQQQHNMFPGMQNLAQLSSALGGQSTSNMFGYPPYFMPMPFSPFSGYSTNPALTAASLLMSNPWLAQMPGFSPSLFPNFFGNASSLMMNKGSLSSYYPQQSSTSIHHASPPPSSPPDNRQLSHDSNGNSSLECEQCKSAFSSVSKLSDHLKSSGHFPKPKNVTRKDNEFEKATKSHSPNSRAIVEEYKRHAITQNNNNSKRTRIGDSHQHLPSDKHHREQNNFTLGSKYLKPHSPHYIKPRHDKTNSVDFIKSLECTIQSAISKVADDQPPRKKRRESPTTPDIAVLNHKPSFSPFSSLSRNIDQAQSSARRSSATSLSPLDLSNTDDRRDTDGKMKATSRTTSPVEISHKDGQSAPVDDPITCIRDNMRSLFAFMNLQTMKNQNGITGEAKSSLDDRKFNRNEVRNKKCYKKQRSNSTSPRLPTTDKMSNYDRSIKHERHVADKRKGPSESILQDLFIPMEDENMPDQNPLLQMENLVNHQLGKSEYVNKSSKKKSWPKFPPAREVKRAAKLVQNDNKHASPMSALMDFFANSNDYIHQTSPQIGDRSRTNGEESPKSAKKLSSSGPSPNHRHHETVDDEDSEQLRIKMAYFLQSMANSRHLHRSHSPTKPDPVPSPTPPTELSTDVKATMISTICTKLSHYDQITLQVCKEKLQDIIKDQNNDSMPALIKGWINSMITGLNDERHCDFISVNSSDTSINFVCSFCSRFDQTSDIGLFIEHMRSHLNRSTKSPTQLFEVKKDETNICDGKTGINGDENCDEIALSRSPASEIDQPIVPIDNKRKLTNDPIQVSG